ncbi:hypothetical protein LVY75_28350 [Sinorhizobium sp. B11]
MKAYSIALDVLGRASNFDASNDPIVRIEVSRLRSSVENYYEAFGAERDVTIHIPKGTYVTLFPRSHLSYEHEEDEPALEGDLPEMPDDVPVSEVAGSIVTAPPSGRPLAMHAGVALLLCAAIAAGVVVYASKPPLTVRPSVTLSMDAVDTRLQGEASQTRDMLLTALTQFQTLTVAKSGYADVRTQKVVGMTYEIDMKYYGDGDIRSVWWQIVDRRSGDLLKSGLETIAIDGKSPAAARQEIVDVLARRFAATRGRSTISKRMPAARSRSETLAFCALNTNSMTAARAIWWRCAPAWNGRLWPIRAIPMQMRCSLVFSSRRRLLPEMPRCVPALSVWQTVRFRSLPCRIALMWR